MSIPPSARRKKVQLRQLGRSKAALIPKSWLERLGITADRVELVEADFGIVIRACVEEASSIEDEPDFALFLQFLADKAFRHPEHLREVVEMTAKCEELVRDVPIE